MSITSLFQTANSIINSVTAGQVATGQNIAGINDPNYHKINTSFIAKQNGVTARFTRAYNQYTERSFVNEATSQHRWTIQNELISNIQNVFNESGEREGIGKTLTKFFTSWSGLATTPSNVGSKVEVIEVAKTLAQLLQNAHNTIEKEQLDTQKRIENDVTKVNSLLSEIASLNKLISTHHGTGTDFTLLDKRDALTRELSEYIDINIVNANEDNYTLTTKSGYTLVNGDNAYTLELKKHTVIKDVTSQSTYQGTVHFDGSSNYEYKIEMVSDGAIGVAEFRVSVDGGKTWLTNPQTGNTSFTTTADPNNPLQIGDLKIWFDAGDVVAGDSFTVIPKLALFWKSTTASMINITPQQYADGVENPSRLTGGSLAGLFSFKDTNAGQYKTLLNTFTKEFIWNVNRIYSQGASTKISQIIGTQGVQDINQPLGSTQAGLPYGDKLTAGSFTIYQYDADGNGTPFVVNFDPANDSLQDIVNKINNPNPLPANHNVMASITPEGTLELKVRGTRGQPFVLGEDTTGLFAGLGMNTLFTGYSASNIGVNPSLVRNPSLLHTGKALADGSINIGDNSIALALADLQSKSISIQDSFGNRTETSLFDYYNAIATKVGSDVTSSGFQSDYYKAQAGFWYAKGQSEYGVSQDEELTYSMQLQDLYRAGTKLIDTARTMLESLLSVV